VTLLPLGKSLGCSYGGVKAKSGNEQSGEDARTSDFFQLQDDKLVVTNEPTCTAIQVHITY
jgi:hypothetical protein